MCACALALVRDGVFSRRRFDLMKFNVDINFISYAMLLISFNTLVLAFYRTPDNRKLVIDNFLEKFNIPQ